MQVNLLWTGREYYLLENCLVSSSAAGAEIRSTIVGQYGEKLYHVDYVIRTNAHWETVFFDIHSRHSDHEQHLRFESDGRGNWTHQGKKMNEFAGCIDIDLPLTPFTNTLPIRRLQLAIGETAQIQVLYIDLLENKLSAVRQQYTRLSATEYHYENVPNDFEADIVVDKHGLVVNYPALFVRTAAVNSNYQVARF